MNIINIFYGIVLIMVVYFLNVDTVDNVRAFLVGLGGSMFVLGLLKLFFSRD